VRRWGLGPRMARSGEVQVQLAAGVQTAGGRAMLVGRKAALIGRASRSDRRLTKVDHKPFVVRLQTCLPPCQRPDHSLLIRAC
jgi:hypothetical protein